MKRAGRGSVVIVIVIVAVVIWLAGCRGPMDLQGGGGGPKFGGGDPNVATSSPVKHLIVVVFQNRSFDHLFGHFPPPNGQTVEAASPSSPGWSQTDANGQVVSPTLRTDANAADMPHGHANYLASFNNGGMDGFAAEEGDQAMQYYDQSIPGVDTFYNYATQYVLADHYFSSAMTSAPAQMFYAVSATDNDVAFSTQPVYGPCNQPDSAATANTAENVGDQMTSHKIGWIWYHEAYGQCGNYVPQQNPFQYFTSTQNSEHIQDLNVFYLQLQSGEIPSVSFVQMAPSHSGHPGSSSITAAAAWLDQFVKQVQGSSVWESTAIMVVWDEGGGWYDHVAPPQIDSQGLGIRVPMMVISPFAKKGVVYHNLADHTSILRFIQWNWGLPPLNSRNSQLDDLQGMFAF
ncbi:MAG: alkaline phosphatase family protein [Acidobacteriaceae bacterium]